jgi:hypothetical protein
MTLAGHPRPAHTAIALFAAAFIVMAAATRAPAQDPPDSPPASSTEDYGAILRRIEALDTYNRQVDRLVTSQEAEIATILDELSRIDDVSRGIAPLMDRMVDALAAFVELDLPFLARERAERISGLRATMARANVSEADKYRRILEAYQIENEYGRSIEAYRSTLTRGDRELTVDFLRVGRIALIYQTLDESQAGVWNQASRDWQALDGSYRTAIRRGLRIARKQAAPDLILVPLPRAKPAEGEV